MTLTGSQTRFAGGDADGRYGDSTRDTVEWPGAWIAVAYTWRSIADTFHAQRQIRQNRQPPGLRAASVKVPLQFSQAQTPWFTWAIALARSNIHSNDIAGTVAPGRAAIQL